MLQLHIVAVCLSSVKVVDHYENPRNVGSLDKNNRNVGTGLVGAPACGDVMKLQVRTPLRRSGAGMRHSAKFAQHFRTIVSVPLKTPALF